MATTSDRDDPRLTSGVDDQPTGQAEAYLVDDGGAERVRPVRRSYLHTRGCGARTTMAQRIAETYASNPGFYGATYCTGCGMHRPVAEFDWLPGDGEQQAPADQLVVGS